MGAGYASIQEMQIQSHIICLLILAPMDVVLMSLSTTGELSMQKKKKIEIIVKMIVTIFLMSFQYMEDLFHYMYLQF